MLFKIIVLCCATAYVFAAPSTDVVPLEKQQPTVIPIVSQSEELEPNGTYKYSYETGNGIKREETSYDKVLPKAKGRSVDSNEGGENSTSSESDEIHVQEGSYSYTAPDGTLISVRYIADENGFQPIGDHIPKVSSSQSTSNSAEKLGRSLKLSDSSPAASSAPIKSAASPTASAAPTVSAALTASAAPTVLAVPTSEESKKSEPGEASTIEAAKTTESSESASTTVSAESEATTKASEPTTGTSTTTATDESSSSSEASTEAASTTTSA